MTRIFFYQYRSIITVNARVQQKPQVKETDSYPSSLMFEKTLSTDNSFDNSGINLNDNNDTIININKNMEQQNRQSNVNETVSMEIDNSSDVSNKVFKGEKMSEIDPPEEIERIILGVESVVMDSETAQETIVSTDSGSFTVSLEQKPVQSLGTDATEVEAVETKISEDEGKCIF